MYDLEWRFQRECNDLRLPGDVMAADKYIPYFLTSINVVCLFV